MKKINLYEYIYAHIFHLYKCEYNICICIYNIYTCANETDFTYKCVVLRV